MRYISYARICVYMDISKELPEEVKISWEDEKWFQPINYEHIPFRCRRCHEHGHLFQDCPLNAPVNPPKINKEETYVKGFAKVTRRKR